MKKWLKITLIILLVTSVTGLLAFVSSLPKTLDCSNVQIKIKGDSEAMFISEEEILADFETFCSDHSGDGEDLDLKAIETHINQIPSVYRSEIYQNVNGTISIEVELKTVIGRIVNKQGNSFYLDNHGTMMPVVDDRPARVCIVNGHIAEEYSDQVYYMNNDSIARVSVIDDIYNILAFIHKDKFWKAQIEQIYVTEDKKFVLIPKVGMHEIMFGDASHIEGKFKKLELFYRSGINRVGWEKYKMIDIQYKGQVVGTGYEDAIIPLVSDSTTNNNDTITNGQTHQ